MTKEDLIFCPLGGSGQIGGNMNLYAYGNEENKKWTEEYEKVTRSAKILEHPPNT